MDACGIMFERLFPSFLITFREAPEAALLAVIMVSDFKKVGKGELNRYAYFGLEVPYLPASVIWVKRS